MWTPTPTLTTTINMYAYEYLELTAINNTASRQKTKQEIRGPSSVQAGVKYPEIFLAMCIDNMNEDRRQQIEHLSHHLPHIPQQLIPGSPTYIFMI